MDDVDDVDDEENGDRDERIFRPPPVVIPMSYLINSDVDTLIQFLERQAGASMNPEEFYELIEEAQARGVEVELIMEVVLAFTFKSRV